MSSLVVPALLGAVAVCNPRKRMLFLAVATVAMIGEAEEEEEEHARRVRRRAWWQTALNKRAPRLSSGDGTWRTRRYFGAISNYGANLAPPNPLHVEAQALSVWVRPPRPPWWLPPSRRPVPMGRPPY